jgi:hypothetical protein
MTPTADSLQGFRNRIINGDMRIDQRNAGASVDLPDGEASYAFAVDRFASARAGGSTATAQQSTTAPTGFTNSLLYTTGTAITPGSGVAAYIQQFIEGFNIADLGWGTPNAQAITLSFWVRSSLTGTFGGMFKNAAVNRTYAYTYIILSPDTWEFKTITIPGDTTGTWLTNNGRGISLGFDMGSGSSQRTTAGTWSAGNFFGATGSVQLNTSSGATFYITGVQLEAGSTATPFERRPFGAELALCQRYYYRAAVNSSGVFSAADGNLAYTTLSFKVSMRATPSAAWVSGGNISAGVDIGSITGGDLIPGTTHSPEVVGLRSAGGSGVSTGAGIILYNSPIWQFSAEL